MHKAFTAEVSTPFGNGTLTVCGPDSYQAAVPSAIVNGVSYRIGIIVEKSNGEWKHGYCNLTRTDGRATEATFKARKKVAASITALVAQYAADNPMAKIAGSLTAILYRLETQRSKLAEVQRLLTGTRGAVEDAERALAAIEQKKMARSSFAAVS